MFCIWQVTYCVALQDKSDRWGLHGELPQSILPLMFFAKLGLMCELCCFAPLERDRYMDANFLEHRVDSDCCLVELWVMGILKDHQVCVHSRPTSSALLFSWCPSREKWPEEANKLDGIIDIHWCHCKDSCLASDSPNNLCICNVLSKLSQTSTCFVCNSLSVLCASLGTVHLILLSDSSSDVY